MEQQSVGLVICLLLYYQNICLQKLKAALSYASNILVLREIQYKKSTASMGPLGTIWLPGHVYGGTKLSCHGRSPACTGNFVICCMGRWLSFAVRECNLDFAYVNNNRRLGATLYQNKKLVVRIFVSPH